MMKHLTVAIVALGLAMPTLRSAAAEEMTVSIEIPRLNVSEYHRPYIAVWIQDGKRKVASNLAVWYQMKTPEDEVGTKWLPDLRQWWRRSGRSLDMPIDGVSGATRPVGTHELEFTSKDKQLAQLKPGKYTLVVEASREVGGRELLEIPFTWPAEKPVTDEVEGEEELGKVTLTTKP